MLHFVESFRFFTELSLDEALATALAFDLAVDFVPSDVALTLPVAFAVALPDLDVTLTFFVTFSTVGAAAMRSVGSDANLHFVSGKSNDVLRSRFSSKTPSLYS